MKDRIIIMLMLVAFATGANAQSTAAGQVEAGVRLGLPLGVTGRYFFTERSAGEAIVGLYNRTASLTALYQYHFDLSALTTQGFGWYVGGGAHIGTRKVDASHKFLAGLDGVAGVNYNFSNIPLNLGLDWKPAVHFGHPSDLADFGVSARYIFGRNRK